MHLMPRYSSNGTLQYNKTQSQPCSSFNLRPRRHTTFASFLICLVEEQFEKQSLVFEFDEAHLGPSKGEFGYE